MKHVFLGIGLLSLLFVSGDIFANDTQTKGNLSVVPISSGPSKFPRNGVRVPFLTFRVQANEPTQIKEMVVQQFGLSTNDDIESVYVESRYGRSSGSNVGNDGIARIRFRTPYVLEAGEAHVMNIVANLDDARGTIGFRLIDIVSEDYESREEQKISPRRVLPRRNNVTNRKDRDRNTSGSQRTTRTTDRRFRDGVRRSSFDFVRLRSENKGVYRGRIR